MKFAVFPAVYAILAIPACAQTLPDRFPRPLEQLQQYLQLSTTQLFAIFQNNNEFSAFSRAKSRRVAQVQGEIAEETRREPLDALALGQRYAEIEAICRHVHDEAERTRLKNVALLSETQKARLKTLEDALKLLPLIAEAKSSALLESDVRAPLFLNSLQSRADGAFVSFAPSVPGCQVPAGLVPGVIREAAPSADRP